MLYVCVLIGLDWAESMMHFLFMSHAHAFSMHTYLFSIFLIFETAWDFFDCLYFFPSLLVYVRRVYGT